MTPSVLYICVDIFQQSNQSNDIVDIAFRIVCSANKRNFSNSLKEVQRVLNKFSSLSEFIQTFLTTNVNNKI
jgi:hypothetical protein